MPRGRMGGRHGMSTEKAKDFKGTMKKLMGYLAQYKIGLLLVVIFAIGSTIFNIAGPKILGKATTELFHGLISKVSGGSGIDFDKIAKILIGLMCLQCIVLIYPGIHYDRSFPETDLQNEKRDFGKD